MRKIKPLNDRPMLGAIEPMYPMIHFTETDLPEIKDWEVGREYGLKLKVKMTSVSMTPSDTKEAHFDILEVGADD